MISGINTIFQRHRSVMHLRRPILFALTFTVMSGCGGSDNNGLSLAEQEAQAVATIFERDRERIIEQLALDIIPQGYEALAEETTALRLAAAEFCTNPSSIALSDLRASWGEAKSQHAFTQAMEFGEPVNDLDGSANQTRARRLYISDVADSQLSSRITQLIQGDAEITEAMVASSNITNQGFQALEYVLFGAEGIAENPPVVADFSGSLNADRRCDYVVAATQNLDTIANAIRTDWAGETSDFPNQFITAGNGSTVYADRATALDDVFSVVNSLVQVMRDDRLGDVIESQRPSDAETWRSAHSLENFQSNLAGLRAVYSGGSGYGADDFYSVTIGENIGEQGIQITFDDVESGIDLVFDPFSTAVVTEFGRIRLGILQGATAELASLLEERIFTTVTGNSADFNFNDGD